MKSYLEEKKGLSYITADKILQKIKIKNPYILYILVLGWFWYRCQECNETSIFYIFRSGDDSDIDVKNVMKPLHVYIDGPFGAPTSQIFHAQHAVLIGTGIGVTPFASILKSIMHRLESTSISIGFHFKYRET